MQKPIVLFQSVVLFTLALSASLTFALRIALQTGGREIARVPLDPFSIVAYVLIGTLIILFISRFFERARTVSFRIVFVLALFGGVQVFLSAFFSLEITFLLAVLLLAYRMVRPSIFIHNLLVILSAGGIAGVLGLSLGVSSAVLLLSILSLYDIVAVYQTRHMIYMARSMIEANAFLGFIIPESLSLYAQQTPDARPHEGFMFLGAGDIVVPGVFMVSALGVSLGAALAVVFGALVGVSLNHYILVRYARPIPALPLIALGAIAFFYLYRIILF